MYNVKEVFRILKKITNKVKLIDNEIIIDYEEKISFTFDTCDDQFLTTIVTTVLIYGLRDAFTEKIADMMIKDLGI